MTIDKEIVQSKVDPKPLIMIASVEAQQSQEDVSKQIQAMSPQVAQLLSKLDSKRLLQSLVYRMDLPENQEIAILSDTNQNSQGFIMMYWKKIGIHPKDRHELRRCAIEKMNNLHAASLNRSPDELEEYRERMLLQFAVIEGQKMKTRKQVQMVECNPN